MSDKSFGDHTNRNIVKNPLLSTAVTGLSLEELTHNAVLLPVAQSQELIARQEQQPGPQNVSQTELPSGDANTNITRPQLFTPSDSRQIVSTPEQPTSKALLKSDDDFDVNEYFARLQGSRYVSAPLNTQANLNAPEENLEEINLNEPDKTLNVEVQQSLTADIAQNFSQLPTVLPQVASAVFSSFSNMLNYKSREQTPDERPVQGDGQGGGYQEVQFEKPGESEVLLMGSDEVSAPVLRAVAPPPKEPPIGGTSSSFRINTKKKTYAQIPGLSSTYENLRQNPNEYEYRAVAQTNYTPSEAVSQQHALVDSRSVKNETEKHMDQSVPKEYNILNPMESRRNENIQVPNVEPIFYDVKTNETADGQSEQIVPTQPGTQQMIPSAAVPQDSENASQTNAGIIPPPPMFSNLSKRDNFQPVGKAVLPPSVARRIGANNPIMKPNTMQSSAFPINNIFVPAPVSDNVLQDTSGLERRPSLDPSTSESPDPAGPSAFVQFKAMYTTTNRTPYESRLSEAHTKAYSHSKPSFYPQPEGSAPRNIQAPPPNTSPRLQSPPNQFALPEHMTIPPTYNPANISTITMNMSVPKKTEAFDPSYQSGILAPQLPTFFHQSRIPSRGLTLPRSPDAAPPNLFNPEFNQNTSITPATFLNPATSALNVNVVKTGPINPPPQSIAQYFDQSVSTEATKPISEPPKVTGGLNYRMTKKRPQYYSGPIEGVGAISNNVKPVVPGIEATAFQGALFTPDQTQLPEQQVPSEQAAVPFDISKPAEMTSSYAAFAINNQINNQAQSYVAPEYNTAFDLSRPTTENYESTNYEPPKQDSKGFGIIGSLKSKLSSIDINKIQHSVTTFFDPAYNDPQKDPSDSQGSAPHQNNHASIGYSNQESSLEIYVPNVEAYGQSYNSQGQYQNIYSSSQLQGRAPSLHHHTHTHYHKFPDSQVPNYTDVTGKIAPPQVLQPSMNPTNNEERSQIIDANRVFAETPYENRQTDIQAIKNQHNVLEKDTEITNTASIDVNYNTYNLFANTNVATLTPTAAFGPSSENLDNLAHHPLTPGGVIDENTKDVNSPITHSLTPGPASSKTNANANHLVQKPSAVKLEPATAITFFDNVVDQLGGLQLISDKVQENTSILSKAFATESKASVFPDFGVDTIKSSNLFGIGAFGKDTDFVENTFGCGFERKLSVEDITNEVVKTIVTDLLESEEADDKIPTVDMSSVPLFGLSTILAEKAKEITDLEDDMLNVTLGEEMKDLNTVKGIKSCDHVNNIPSPKTKINEDISDLNICGTCREIDIPEDKEANNLTNKLIENITSPVQLSNPVSATLTEFNKPNDGSADFEHKQCSEISYITEETIDTMQVHSATNLLDDIDEVNDTNIRNYGWSTENENVLSSKVPADHSYTFQVDPSAIGFFGNNPMFFENIPNNASDELKAEFKSSQDDVPVVFPRQMSIPSAPPAEDDDTKSDETGGLDVLSIEQDAKKDFPIYEEFVIEPSETDDDKIEYKEKEKTSEDSENDEDSFTNRVEKFKLMEETVETNNHVLESQNNFFDLTSTTSPPITIASYFDTGNYAVEAHYRNSLSSPTIPLVSPPEGSIRIPPGFEDEYNRRVSELVVQDIDTDNDDDKHVPKIPETSTQTRPVVTTTYSNVPNLSPTLTVSSNAKRKDDESAYKTKLPDFSSVFCKSHEAGDSQPSAISNIEDKPASAALLFGPPEVVKTAAQSVPLLDPISFFSAGTAETTNTGAADSDFHRLASYFQTPAKTDHGKSFFELSQSQNHYRHALGTQIVENNNQIAQNSNVIRDFIDSNKSQNSFNPISNIPSDVLSKNSKLMQDLTSIQNLSFQNDQIVRTVNYLTVEYDNVEIKAPLKTEIKNTTQPDKEDSDSEKLEENDCEKTKDDNSDNEFITIVSKCIYCCNLDPRNVVTINKIEIERADFRYKKSMNAEGTEPNKEKPSEMSQPQEERRRGEVAVTFDDHLDEGNGVSILSENRNTGEYSPVKHHWFYRVDVEGKSIWRGFSANDSKALEEAFNSPELNENTLVPTDGGRFDVNVMGRLRLAVYWTEKPTNVRRCSWFYKGATDARYVPYTEPVAEKLEEEYRHGVTTGEWHRRLLLPGSESVVMHGPAVMVHFPQAAADAFSSTPQSTMRPRVVRRGCDETEIEDPEPSNIDHLLLLCHGVGSACDMRFRNVEEVVDDFRATSLQLLQSHYRSSYDSGAVNRVEVLPISWHSSLHSGSTGVDRRLAAITLDSIPRLRNFTNDTVLDVLFYTSPVFCQTIIDAVCGELNRIYELFKSRNPGFKGNVSLGGHSLGSVILYDLLCHQATEASGKSFVSGPAGTGQPSVAYPALAFRPAAMYALGSPIAMFECIRGVSSLGGSFALPTCNNFFNIFHPYDPIAYRIEPLINPSLGDVKPSQIPHHKGRKRMHLELKDTMARVGADLKQKLMESIRATWSSMWKAPPPPSDGQLEKVVEEEIEKEQLCDTIKEEIPPPIDLTSPALLGRLNAGRRVDYVLQEAPFEMINEYLFAMSSHVCYWESEDTMLLILREVYSALGVAPDGSLPQRNMSVPRAAQDDNESIATNASEHPSTSRGGT